MSLLAKLKEKAEEHVVAGVFVLTLLLLGVIWAAVPTETWHRISAATPKPALWATIGLLALGLLLESAYLIDLRHKYKLKPRFGVYWDRELTPYCPACSKAVAYIKHPNTNALGGTWGFKCVQCSGFIPLNDDDGRSIEIAEAKRLLSSLEPIPEPELDETDIQILTLLAEQSNEGGTAQEFALVLNLHPEHANHRLAELLKRKYIFAPIRFSTASTDVSYHLDTKGRTLLVARKLI